MAVTKKRSRLNNMKLSYQRNDLTYEAVYTDLYLLGIITKDTAEQMIGRYIDNVRLPEGFDVGQD